MRRTFSLVMILMSILISSAVYAQPMETIGVVGVTNRANNMATLDWEEIQNLGIAEEYLIDGLVDGGKLDVIDLSAEVTKARVDEVILALDQEEPISGLIDSEVDYLVYGYLENICAVRSGLEVYTDTILDAKNITVHAYMTARVVEAATGRTVLTVHGHGESGAALIDVQNKDARIKIGTIDVMEECVHNALEKAVDELAYKINNAA